MAPIPPIHHPKDLTALPEDVGLVIVGYPADNGDNHIGSPISPKVLSTRK